MIALRPPSNQKPYDEYWSGDSAFNQPDTRDPETVAEHARLWLQARRTGDYTVLRVAGREPTKFVCRLIDGPQLRWIYDRCNVGDDEKAFGAGVTTSLAFRCSILEIHNIGFELPIRFIEHPHLGRIADENIVAILDNRKLGGDPAIVSELGSLALWRAREVDPL